MTKKNKTNEIVFNIAWRKPKYPVIIISNDGLYAAFNINQLAKNCVASIPIDKKNYIQVIDSTGEEFWYSPGNCILSPGFSFKRWTKKKIIETFNRSQNAESKNQQYSMKSISAKRLDRIIRDICEMLMS
ncbi:MAG: hypothetical protein ACLFQM_11605 [Fidelibacterota bacterium]